MSRHPVLHLLDTRAVERKEVVRRFALGAELERSGPDELVLRTIDGETSVLTRWPEGATPEPALRVRERELHRGTLRIECASDRIFRVRYAPADRVPENPTPMLQPTFSPPRHVRVIDAPDRVVLETDAARLVVEKKPLVMRLQDPQGRELCRIGGRERNQLNQWDALNTGVCRTAAARRPIAVECFGLRTQEAVYGFGEKFLRLDKVGQTIDLNMLEATGTTTPRSYKNVPFFWTTSGYGVFFHHSCRITAWVGTLCATDVQVALEDDFLDYWLFAGDPKQILDAYGSVTGRASVPPDWSFGFWQSKISYRSAAEAQEVVRKNRHAGIPMDVLHLDTHWFRRDWFCDLEFDPERFPDPRAFLTGLREEGVKVCLWQLPYIPEGSSFFDELAAVDGFVKRADGSLYDVGICYTPGFEGRVGCIDFTNPAAVRVYQARLARLFALGASAIKVDFGEQAPLDGIYHDGTPGHRAHNLYPLLYTRAVAEATERGTGESIVWARSAWAGSQRYPLHWGGDSSANWENLGPQLAGGLSLGLSGFSFWSQDIGGFFGETGGDLLVRWMQAGAFLSHARIHGMGPRELPDFEPSVRDACRDVLRLRYRLLPYLLASARACAARTLPMARALVVDWPDDPSTWAIADQWLLGEFLLVAPILDSTGRRRVYLPAGTWTDWASGARLEGRRWIERTADVATLPLYVREGGIIPMAHEMEWVGQRPVDELEVILAPFTGEGISTLRVPVGSEEVPIRYTSASGRHRLEVGSTSIRVRVTPIGMPGLHVDLVQP